MTTHKKPASLTRSALDMWRELPVKDRERVITLIWWAADWYYVDGRPLTETEDFDLVGDVLREAGRSAGK